MMEQEEVRFANGVPCFMSQNTFKYCKAVVVVVVIHAKHIIRACTCKQYLNEIDWKLLTVSFVII